MPQRLNAVTSISQSICMPQYWCIRPPTSHKSLQHRHLSSLSARVCRDSNVACGVLCTLNTWLSWHYTCYVFARWQVYFLSIVQKIFIQVWSPNVNACIISRINLVHCQRYIIRFITLPERDLVSSIIMLFCSALEDAHPRLFHHSFLSSFVISFLLFSVILLMSVIASARQQPSYPNSLCPSLMKCVSGPLVRRSITE